MLIDPFKYSVRTYLIGFIAIVAMLFLMATLSGCKFSRQLAKTEVKKDSVYVAKLDSVGVQKHIDQSSEKLKSTTTIVEKQGQPIYLTQPNGETKVIFPPADRTTQIDMEMLNQLFSLKMDSASKEKTDSGGKSEAARGKDVSEKAGPSFIEWALIAGMVVLLLVVVLPKLPFSITKK